MNSVPSAVRWNQVLSLFFIHNMLLQNSGCILAVDQRLVSELYEKEGPGNVMRSFTI